MEHFGLYPSGNRVTDKPEILFARLDLKEVLEKVEKLHPKKEEPKEEVKERKRGRDRYRGKAGDHF